MRRLNVKTLCAGRFFGGLSPAPATGAWSKTTMTTVTVCVGSSCHIKGARKLIMRLNEMIKQAHLEQQVELQGSFCMERCGEGLNWQIGDKPITSDTVDDAVETFRSEIIKPLKGGTREDIDE